MNALARSLSFLLTLLAVSAGADEAKVDTFIRAEMAKRGVPGVSVAVVREGKVVLARGYGSANAEHQVPARAETVYQLASVTKQFTAAAVLLLASDGKLSLDDNVRKYVPEVPDFGTPITLRHLIHHTSGLRDFLEMLEMAGWRNDDVITE